jgi:hypothetical protein
MSDFEDVEGFRGTYAFVYTDEMRSWWEHRIRAELGDDAAVEEAMSRVDAEARDAEIEITPDAQVVSRSGGQEAYRAPLRVESGSVCFDKPNGKCVVLTRQSAHELTADEPGKPPMRFLRK